MNSLLRPDFDTTLQDFEVPGAAVAVVKDDAIVFAAGYGTRELGRDLPVNEHTLFAAGSISKSFTATALAMLVGEGKLAWDDPVTHYLPGFQLHDAYATREITIRDLLTHRCGLADVSGGTLWYGSTYDRAEVIRRLRYLKPVSSFRSRFAYQNVMYLVAGEIIPAASGVSWDEFVRERILKPLGMTSSNTSVNDLAAALNVAQPHARIDGKVQRVAYRNYDNVAPAASINTSAVDLAQYARLYLKNGHFGDQALLAPEPAAELVTAQTIIPIDPRPPELQALTPKFYAYGLGWFLRDYRGRKLIIHTGGVDGMTALLALVPEEQAGVVVLANQEEALIGATCYHMLDVLLGETDTDWFAAYQAWRQRFLQEQTALRDKVIESRRAGTSPSLAPGAYAGTYGDVLYGEAAVSQEADRLVLRFSHTPSFTGDLEHWHYDTFRIHWRDPMIPPGLVTFPLTSGAQIDEMKFDQPKLLDADFAELNFRRMADQAEAH